MALIKPLSENYDEYRRDESRAQGNAETISFPTSEDEVRAILRELHAVRTPVTVQGARTGLAAGAVPAGHGVLRTVVERTAAIERRIKPMNQRWR